MKATISGLSLQKDCGKKQPNTPRDTQKSNNYVDIPKRERGKSLFLTAAFFNCLFLLPFWKEGEVGDGSEIM